MSRWASARRVDPPNVHRGHGDRGRMHRRRRHRVLLAVHRRRGGPGRPNPLRASSGTERDTGPGCAEGAFEAAYGDEDGLPDGRVLCHATNGAYISVWTHADEPILAGMLLDSESGFAVLAETWQRALLDAEPALPPSASAAPSGSGGPTAVELPGAAEPSDRIGERPGGVRGRGAAPMGELCECQLGVRR